MGQWWTRLDIFPLSDLHLPYFLKGTKQEMDTLEEKFLVGSYTPVCCAATKPPVENAKTSGKRKKTNSSTPRTALQ